MGTIPPPRPPTQEEFARRWAAGARSMRDLDPALYAWLEEGRRFRLIAWCAIATVLTLLGSVIAVGQIMRLM